METVTAALLGAISSIVLAVLGYIGAKKLGLGQNQEKLVNVLKDLIGAQEKKIDALNTLVAEANSKLGDMAVKIEKLQDLTIAQASEISSLLSLLSDNQTLKEALAARPKLTVEEKKSTLARIKKLSEERQSTREEV